MRRYIPALLLSVLTILGLTAVLVSIQSSSSSVPPLSIQLNLNKTHVAAGVPIRGEVLLTNASNRTILVNSCALNGWLFVGLANESTPFSLAIAGVYCSPSIYIRPGVNRFSIVVRTRYQQCGPTLVPHCSGSQMPALPRGTYHTSIVALGLPKGTPMPAPLTVTLS
jgi:hypothetical protein